MDEESNERKHLGGIMEEESGKHLGGIWEHLGGIWEASRNLGWLGSILSFRGSFTILKLQPKRRDRPLPKQRGAVGFLAACVTAGLWVYRRCSQVRPRECISFYNTF